MKEKGKQALKSKKIMAIPIILILGLFIAFSTLIWKESNNSSSVLSGFKKVTVKRVVDGDTFIYSENGLDVRVRLIGIDTPESVAPEESGKENTIEGKQVSEYVTSLIEGKNVYLEYDVGTYDKYNRELAYVYFADGRMLQEILLEEGLARTMTIPPNVKYEDKFVAIQEKAINEKRGLWSYE